MLFLLRFARVVVVVGMLLVTSRARADDIPISDEARAHFDAGVTLLEDPEGARFEDAYRAFKAAYAASPSPKILGNLALCAMKLERDGEAIEAYQRYLSEVADIHPSERAQMEKDLAVLDTTAASIEVRITSGGAAALASATVSDERTPVQGAPIVNRYETQDGMWRARLRPGLHRVMVSASGHRDATWVVELAPAARVAHAIALDAEAAPKPPVALPSKVVPAPEPSKNGPTTGFFVGLAVTGVVGAAAAITGGLAAERHARYEDARAAGDVSAGDEIRDTGKKLNIAADVLIGATGVSAAVTLALLIAGLVGDDAEAPAKATLVVAPTRLDVRVAF